MQDVYKRQHKPSAAPILKYMELSKTDHSKVLYIGDSKYCLLYTSLPQILVLGDFIIEKTSCELKSRINLTPQSFTGATRVSGIIRGQVNGMVERGV